MLSKARIKQINALHLKKGRLEAGQFIVEGIKLVTELLRSNPAIVVEVIGTEEFANDSTALLANARVPFTVATQAEFQKLSQLSTPNKVLAVCRMLSGIAPAFDPEGELAIYLDDIRDPGNLGTIIRLADWFGIKNVFCSDDTCELYNPKVIQSTMGAFLRVNVVYASLHEIIDNYKVKVIYGAVLNGNDLYREKLQNGLLIIGNESNGIRQENLVKVNHPITIPAHGNNGTESLNAAMACSVIVSEFFRQLR